MSRTCCGIEFDDRKGEILYITVRRPTRIPAFLDHNHNAPVPDPAQDGKRIRNELDKRME